MHTGSESVRKPILNKMATLIITHVPGDCLTTLENIHWLYHIILRILSDYDHVKYSDTKLGRGLTMYFRSENKD